jgi:uncharacterized Ntn-hydrolase superfamily protein
MTFSIVARSADGRSWGVAVASKFLAVGAAVPAARAGVGAIATQSYANLAYRPDGLRLLAEGHRADEVLRALTEADAERDQRQAGVVDRDGEAATFTGAGCHAWAGGVTDTGAAIQGNILTGPEVVDAIRAAWRDSGGDEPLARRWSRRWPRATAPAATGAGGRAPRCWSSARERATAAAATSRWTCGSTTPSSPSRS